jgi:SagB-type dehydrogenase family enzyme
MYIKLLLVLTLVFLLFHGCALPRASSTGPSPTFCATPAKALKLPPPSLKGMVSLEESLFQRRSIREFSSDPLKLEDISQLLWSAQGITQDAGRRTAPSAGGLYPLEVYLVAGNVRDLDPGVYKYLPEGHEIILINNSDLRAPLAASALGQSPVKDGAINIVISAVYARSTPRYGDRGIRYVHLEAGHAAQNVCLQAAALDLGAVTVGAFEDIQIKNLLGLPEEENPLYIIPVGHKR